MNSNLYRIIFNARRGLRMAVAETATAQGKSASGDTATPSTPAAPTASDSGSTVRFTPGLPRLTP